jgi:hypothetical protein
MKTEILEFLVNFTIALVIVFGIQEKNETNP